MTGLAGTLIIILGVMLSASLQLLSIWIVFNFFLDKDDKYKLGDLRDWRVLYGHNIEYLDSDAGSSLVAKMCNGGLVDRAWWQFQLLDEVNKYLHPLLPGADGLGVGVVLSSIALTIWIFNITAELQSIWSFTWSIWRLPRRETLVLTESASEENRVLQSISCGRLGMLTVMLMVRTGIAVALGWAGARWLAVTPDIKDILLNAVALLFILEIDELLYKVLAPKHAIKFMSSIRALPVGHRKTWAGVDVYCILKLFIMTLVLVLFIGCNVIHNAKEAQQAKDVLCGGNQDFVHSVHPELGLVTVADTKPFKPHAGFEIPGMRKVLDDVVSKYDLDTFVRVGGSWGRVQEDDESPIILHSEDGVNQLSDWAKSPLNSASMPVACRDQEIGGIVYYPGSEIPAWGPAGSTYAAFTSWAWQSLTAMTGATNCTQARAFCDDMAMPLVPVLCPDTCGCNAADSGITFDYGCLEQCRGTVGAFRESLEQAPCQDFTGEAQRQEAWQRFWTLYWTGGSGDTLRDYLQGNCSVVPVPKFCNFYPWTHHGQRDVELRPLTVLCPETCGCADSSDSDSVTWCPKSCVSREAV